VTVKAKCHATAGFVKAMAMAYATPSDQPLGLSQSLNRTARLGSAASRSRRSM
jgi:hypothetical protein